MNYVWLILLILIIIIFFLFIFDKIPDLHSKMYPEYYRDPYFQVKGVDQDNVLKGKTIASNKKIVFCGLCRNIEKMIGKNIQLLELLGRQFDDFKIILFENDSEDQTRQIIKSYSETIPNLILLDCGPDNPNCIFKEKKMYEIGALSNTRIQKMAYFRNEYLKYIKKNLSNYDYVMMMDMDIEGYFNMDGFFEVLAKEDWDAMFINGRIDYMLSSVMYDSLAYVRSNCQYDEYLAEKQNNLGFIQKTIKNLLETPEKEKWIPVKSAFNGCGIYKMETILSSDFSNIYSCEWIDFHKKASDQGRNKFYIARDWLIYVGFQGPRPVSLVSNFLKKILSK
jgi:glycosyltransferase involved in cell wall biosynthesis